jgi:hypothetical protein
MERRQMSVIEEPADGTRNVIMYAGEGTVAMRSQGPIVYVCGGCREPILHGLEVGQAQGMVFRCNGCGAYNETLE